MTKPKMYGTEDVSPPFITKTEVHMAGSLVTQTDVCKKWVWVTAGCTAENKSEITWKVD